MGRDSEINQMGQMLPDLRKNEKLSYNYKLHLNIIELQIIRKSDKNIFHFKNKNKALLESSAHTAQRHLCFEGMRKYYCEFDSIVQKIN